MTDRELIQLYLFAVKNGSSIAVELGQKLVRLGYTLDEHDLQRRLV